MGETPKTMPCSHHGCVGTMHLQIGPDPTLQGTSHGLKSRTVEYYRCDVNGEHTHVVREIE